MEHEFVEIELRLDSRLLEYVDALVAQGIIGRNREEVINHVLRQYLFERAAYIPPVTSENGDQHE